MTPEVRREGLESSEPCGSGIQQVLELCKQVIDEVVEVVTAITVRVDRRFNDI